MREPIIVLSVAFALGAHHVYTRVKRALKKLGIA